MSEKDQEIKDAVRQRYGNFAKTGTADCGCSGSASASPCCGGHAQPAQVYDQQSAQLGYSTEELASVPEGANLGLGCGNPQAIAAIKKGETVLDLGSGAGFDCFLALRQTGENGKVIGIDMTPDMISKARANARKTGYTNVEFRLGEIEHLPVADGTADVIISNWVINLSTDKPAVFRESFRVLKPGGRLAVSDVVATAELPAEVRNNLELYSACAGGAAMIDDLEKMLAEAGFTNIRIAPKDESRQFIRDWSPEHNLQDYIISATIEAVKPLH
jgi:arsenite methyltransferase